MQTINFLGKFESVTLLVVSIFLSVSNRLRVIIRVICDYRPLVTLVRYISEIIRLPIRTNVHGFLMDFSTCMSSFYL
jgi:hypothetical protein